MDALAKRTNEDPYWLDVDALPEGLCALVSRGTFSPAADPDSGGVATAKGVPAAVEQARRVLAPGRPTERHEINLPERRSLELDAELMAAWPQELWWRAYRLKWEEWTWPRLPTVGEFRGPIAGA